MRQSALGLWATWHRAAAGIAACVVGFFVLGQIRLGVRALFHACLFLLEKRPSLRVLQ